MNRKTDILYGALLLLGAGGLFQACQQDVLDDVIYDKETLIAQGRYLTARSGDAFALQDPTTESHPFEVGTPYRLLAFSKPYDASDPTVETPVAQHPRFNKVAWEGETGGNLRFINIDSNPDKWFGFSALDGETSGTDQLVSLDFYGFTYGMAEDAKPDYIALDGWSDKTTKLSALTHKESVVDGQLKDLMRGVLLNQNIATAGVASTGPDGFQTGTPYTQSVIPFKHCFSKLRFQVSQESEEDDKTAPAFGENLVLEKIEVTGSYENGIVSLADGKVKVSDKMDRELTFDDDFSGKVTLTNTNVGEMVLFPSDGSSLNNDDMADGYDVGLKITVKSTVRKDIENMLANTGSTGGITEKTDADGTTTWYEGTIVKDKIIDYYTDVTAPNRVLHFKQNTSYMLIIAFQKNAVRIITVIPQIEEWLPGEGTPDEPWQDQALGQPQMFDNIVWSDRNLGADHYDPEIEFEETIGYFYQSGRNIPYYPFDTKEYYMFNGGNAIRIPGKEFPSPEDADNSILANVENASESRYMFYPIVDERIILINNTSNSQWWGGPRNSWIWSINTEGKNVQLFIPEKKPDKADNIYFDYVRQNGEDPSDLGNKHGLTAKQDMHWELGQHNQPTSGAWIVPTSDDFMSIFPSTPHAGNITFRAGGNNSTPMIGWGNMGSIDSKIETLRVTVPFYEPDTQETKDNEAWKVLAKYENDDDKGTTNIGAYKMSPKWDTNLNYEPKGDPEEGYASAYVISRKGEDESFLPLNLQSLKVKNGNKETDKYCIKSWGTIYAIKRIYTPQAYRMRWRVICKTYGTKKDAAGMFVEICRYRCNATDHLNESNYMDYDWEHPAATIYFPICGLGDWTGQYINFGTECQYATSDKIADGKTGALQIKITGDDSSNAYIAIVKNVMNRNFGKQIRPIVGGNANSSK